MYCQKAVIVPIHKGGRTQCRDYHTISMLSIPGKVYVCWCVGNKDRGIITERKAEEQGAFQKGRSCVDQLFIVRQVGEKINEKNKRMLMVCEENWRKHIYDCLFVTHYY